MYVYSEVVWCDTLAVKRVNAADLAKEVPRSSCVELILRQRVAAGDELKLALVNLDHERVLLLAD
jgi:hypothetical protein